MSGRVIVLRGDAANLPLPGASVDAVVTDPPYSLPGGFMGREWDAFESPRAFQGWCESWARECLRVLRPGGHMLAFGGTRTWHRLVCGIEDAGFEIRDSVADLTGRDGPGLLWMQGSGWPKSLDVSKAIDKAAGAEREVIGEGPFASRRPRADRSAQGLTFADDNYVRPPGRALTAPATDSARQWEGWGTALKPAWEPVAVARKPLAGSVAANVLEHGTGALNIDACRVNPGELVRCGGNGSGNVGGITGPKTGSRPRVEPHDAGRWPPNVLLGEEAAAGLDRQSGTLTSGASPARRPPDKFRDAYGESAGPAECTVRRGADSGGASRFFPVFRYEAKAGTAERPRLEDGTAWPTVKPLALMRWLVRLVTPPGGTVLDPFCGTGTSGQAAMTEGFDAILIDKDPVAIELTRVRLAKPVQPSLFGGAS